MSVTFLTDKDGVAVTCTSSGNLIAVNDAATMPLQGLHIYGKTTQNGTPSPDVPVELVNAGEDGEIGVAVYGKNIADIAYGAQVPSTGTGYDVSVAGWASDYIYIGNNIVTLTRDDPTAATEMYLFLYDEDKNHIGNIGSAEAGDALCSNRISGYENARYCRVRMSEGSGSSRRLQLEIGSTATAYEPCTAQSLTLSTPNGLPGIPVASGGNYTDENGQRWFCDEVDLKRGVRVQRLGKMVYDGSDDETWIITGTRYRIAVPGMLEHTDATVAPPVMCDKYITVNPNTNYAGTISISAQQWDGAMVLLVKNDDLADVSAFKASLAEKPMEVLAALATPVETPLAAEEIAAYTALRTNKPNTTVFNDSGAGMQLDYSADTKTYIDNKFTELAAAMVSNT